MEHFEMMEKLCEKANISLGEAKEVLERADWDMLEALDQDISLPAYAEYRQQILAFCEAWKDSLATWQLVNLTN